MEEKVIVQEKVVLPKPRKSPVLAFLLSFFFPFGVGPFYNGEVIKALIYLVVFAGLVTMQPQGGAQPFAGILMGAFYIFQIIDSVNVSNKINRRALLGGEVEEDDTTISTEAVTAGSIFWGVLLIADRPGRDPAPRQLRGHQLQDHLGFLARGGHRYRRQAYLRLSLEERLRTAQGGSNG